jgi:hypothetical protein
MSFKAPLAVMSERVNFTVRFLQMVQSIQVLRFHLLELEKVSNLFFRGRFNGRNIIVPSVLISLS